MTEAAAASKVDTSTISRRLLALERKAGATLVRRGRTQPGARLTAEGEALARLAGTVEQAVLALERWPGEQRRERVRLTAPEELVTLVLSPALPRLLEDAPWLKVDLIGTPRTLRLEDGEADLALRMSRPRTAGLVSKAIAAITYSVYRSRAARPRADQWLGLDESLGPWPELAWSKARWPKVPPVLRAGSWAVLTEATLAGLGLSILPDPLVAADPRLSCVERGVGARQVWLVLPKALRKDPSVRAVAAWATSALLLALGAAPAQRTIKG